MLDSDNPQKITSVTLGTLCIYRRAVNCVKQLDLAEYAIAGPQLNTRNKRLNGRAFDKQPEVGCGQTSSFPLASDNTPLTAGRHRLYGPFVLHKIAAAIRKYSRSTFHN